MWQGILGHDEVVNRFRTASAKGRIGGTYLFVGPTGIGKRSMAIQLAKALLCLDAESKQSFIPCGVCESCHMIDRASHPDLEQVAKKADKQKFTIDLLLGDKEHRHREGLLHRLALKPSLSTRKIAIIDDADLFNVESSNALLKTLEEPPPGAAIFLIGTSQNRQLPTIRSRSQIIRFNRLDDAVVAELLLAQGIADDAEAANSLAAAADGSLAEAIALNDDDIWAFRKQFFQIISTTPLNTLQAARDVQTFVEKAGKEPKVRRVRLRQVIGFASDFYREMLRTESGVEPSADPLLENTVRKALNAPGNVMTSVEHLDTCLEALSYIERNANLSTLVEWWVGELSKSH